MSVKKLILLSAAGLAAIGVSAAMAGGPDHMAMPSAPAFQPNVYLEGHFGYTGINWRGFNGSAVLGTPNSAAFTPTSHGRGWLTAGGDLGYSITQNIATEAGWFWLPNVGGSSNGAGGIAANARGGLTVRSWFAYAAGKFSVPVVDHLDLFGKLGVAYRSLKYAKSGSPVAGTAALSAALNAATGSGHYWAPLFGAGMQYDWSNWLLGVQYLYLPGYSGVNFNSAGTVYANGGAPNAAPPANLFTGSLGYKFNV